MKLSRFLLLLSLIPGVMPGYVFSRSLQYHAVLKSLMVKKAVAQAMHAEKLPGQLPIIKTYDWAVVGGGIAGILSIGMLIEHGVSPTSIAWIDKEFEVGAIGKYYQNAPGNLSTRQWISALESCNYLKQCPSNPIAYLKGYDLDSFYALGIIAKPMQDITNWLLTKVTGFKNTVKKINSQNHEWDLDLSGNIKIHAHKVILATGSHPRTLDYKCDYEIPLADALDTQELENHVTADDTVAVVGSSHSAAIALMRLSKLPVKKIVHFYTRPFLYTQQTEDGVINAESGLKGPAAFFAQNYIEKNRIPNLMQVHNTKEERDKWLPQCTKIIYAAGFTPNKVPLGQINPLDYDETTGIIQKNLFGFGIAFPNKKTDAVGKMEYRVGMPHFVEHGKRVIPQWIAMA